MTPRSFPASMQRALAASALTLSGCVFGAALGCGSQVDTHAADDGRDAGPARDAAPAVRTCTAAVSFDPKSIVVAELRSTLPLSIPLLLADGGDAVGDHPLKVVVLRDGVEVATLLDAPRAEALSATGSGLGALKVDFLASTLTAPVPGRYALRATLGCPKSATVATRATQETPLWILRLGAKSIGVGKGDGARIPLMYGAVDHAFKNYFAIPETLAATSLDTPAGEPELDTPAGVPRELPPLWTALDTPKVDKTGAVLETGSTLPVALKLGTRPDWVFTMGKTAAAADGSAPVPSGIELAGLPKLRLVLDGATPTGDEGVLGVGAVTLRAAKSPVPAIARADVVLRWRFEAQSASGDWGAIPGATQHATFTVYGLLGNEQGTTAPQLPWIAVVDEATKTIAGKATDALGASSLLVQHINEEVGLTYDRASGASAYSYPTGSDGWTGEVFALSSFLKRTYGDVVNCSDCASILSTYSNMIGAKLRYCIIGFDFPLNPIEGIGATAFGSPFDSGRLGFSYHAVTSADASAHIYDATLAVDGDDDPKSAPHVRKMVQNMPGPEYLTRLSPGTPTYQYVDQATTVK